MNYKATSVCLAALALSACGATEADDGPEVASTERALLPGDLLRASTITLDPTLACKKLYAPGSASQWFQVFSTTVDMAVGERVLIRSRLRTTSNTTTNILGRTRVGVIEPVGPNDPPAVTNYNPDSLRPNHHMTHAPVDGENNVGYCGPSPCEPSMVVSGFRMFTATKAGVHTFVMEAGAATSASQYADYSVWSGPCAATPEPDYFLTIAEGAGVSFLDVYKVDGEANYYGQANDFAAGYASVDPSTPLAFLDRTYKLPNGRTGVKVMSYLGITVDNTTAQSTSANVRVAAKNLKTGLVTYLPSAAGTTYAITPEKHHKKVYAEGALYGLTPGTEVEVWTEVAWRAGGPWLHVDTGCDASAGLTCTGATTPQSYTAIWPF